MKKFKQTTFRTIVFGLAVFALLLAAFAQKIIHTPFDVKHYKMDVKLDPTSNKLEAIVDIDLNLQKESRVIEFELNGSLVIEEISLVIRGLSP